jgi:hypothetical protein
MYVARISTAVTSLAPTHTNIICKYVKLEGKPNPDANMKRSYDHLCTSPECLTYWLNKLQVGVGLRTYIN